MKKVLMIGLDGATFALLKRFTEDGTMPFLGKFIREGVHGDLMSTQNPLTPPAWISMVTGRSPDVHGIYDFLRPHPEGDKVFLKVNDSRYIRCETIWSLVSRQNRRITSMNFFGMAPPPECNGYLISGFVPWKYLRSATSPASFFDELKAIPGLEHKLLGMAISEEKKCIQGLDDSEFMDWIRLQGDRDGAWVDLVCHLMEKDRTELTAVVLDGPDKMQHLFWRYLDPEYAHQVNGDFDEKIRELCLGFYRDLDQRIERLVAAAGPETNILMTSDHGFGATTEVVYINEWLAQNGYLRWTDQAESDAGTKLTLDKIKDHTTNIDWANTMAYAVTPSSNAIYIRRSSGGGKGVSDADYPAYCRELRDKLLAWENPADGGKVFTDVFFNEPKLAGSDSVAEYAPDLTLRLRDGGFVSIVRSGGEIVRPRLKVDGTHRPNGIFVANGPNIRVGEQIQPLDIVDIAPMLLYGIGLPVPEDLEGRVPEEVFTPETFKQFPVQRGKATISGDVASENEPEVSDEEKEALMAQMKVLGYMD